MAAWSDVGSFVKRQLPVLGGALTSTTLGGQAGSLVGDWIADALGVESNPDQVLGSLKGDPDAMLKMKELQNRHEAELKQIQLESYKAELAADSARQQQVNETIRAELSNDSFFKSGWRPAMGWMFIPMLAWIAGLVGWKIIVDPGFVMQGLDTLQYLIVMLGLIQGINLRGRSMDKQVMRTGQAPKGFMSAISERVSGDAQAKIKAAENGHNLYEQADTRGKG